MDILADWEYFETPIKDEAFEKLLWYVFALDNDQYLKEQVPEYESLIQSDRWGIKFYRYITKNLLKKGNFNVDKNYHLKHFIEEIEDYHLLVEKENVGPVPWKLLKSLEQVRFEIEM